MSMIQPKGLPACFFSVEVLGDVVGSFLSVSGLSLQMEMETYTEGGRNTGPLFFPTGPAVQRLTLERGVMSPDFYALWMAQALSGIYAPLIGQVNMYGGEGTLLHMWIFEDAYPVRIDAPSFHATRSELAVQRVELMYTGAVQLF